MTLRVDCDSRGVTTNGPERILAAGAVVTDEIGRVLLVLRGREPSLGRWSVPGGKVEPGETLREATAREVLEETGLVVSVDRELWAVTVPAGDGRVYEIHDFAATVVAGTLHAGDDAAEAAWFTGTEIRGLDLVDGLLDLLLTALGLGLERQCRDEDAGADP